MWNAKLWPVHIFLIYGSIYALIGVVGYLSFFDTLKENILNNYISSNFDIGILIAQIGIGFTVIFSFPLQCFACRNSLNLIFFNGKEFSMIRHVFWAIVIIIITFIVGTLVPKIGVVFGFVGASAGMAVMSIIPSLIYLKVIVFEDKKISLKNLFHAILPLTIFILGCSMAVVCTVVVVYNGINTLRRPANFGYNDLYLF